MNQDKEKYYLEIINSIQEIRSKNNVNWMDLLRLAFKHSPTEAAEIMQNIYNKDEEISELAKKLTKK
jgi:hypothetical protein